MQTPVLLNARLAVGRTGVEVLKFMSSLSQFSAHVEQYLDLFSTTQTSEPANECCAALVPALKCVNNAPFFAWQNTEKAYTVAQGNCHSWSCPRCGINRAKHEYGRIVEGCRTLAQSHELYFLTITCRGRELSLEQSEAGYYAWTNILLTAVRTRAKRENQAWHYVQVTERQKRGHPHSHILTTWKPHDLYIGTKETWKYINGHLVCENVECLRSDWLKERCVSAGLGDQYDISKVESVEGASRYVAKYMFKDTMFETSFPKHWKRVRYSQSFPELPTHETDAFLLMTDTDWHKLASTALIVNPRDQIAHDECLRRLAGHDVLVREQRPVMG